MGHIGGKTLLPLLAAAWIAGCGRMLSTSGMAGSVDVWGTGQTSASGLPSPGGGNGKGPSGSLSALGDGYKEMGQALGKIPAEDARQQQALDRTRDTLNQMGDLYGSLRQGSGIEEIRRWLGERQKLNSLLRQAQQSASDAGLTALAEALAELQNRIDVFVLWNPHKQKSAYITQLSLMSAAHASGYALMGIAFQGYGAAVAGIANKPIYQCQYRADSPEHTLFYLSAESGCHGNTPHGVIVYLGDQEKAATPTPIYQMIRQYNVDVDGDGTYDGYDAEGDGVGDRDVNPDLHATNSYDWAVALTAYGYSYLGTLGYGH